MQINSSSSNEAGDSPVLFDDLKLCQPIHDALHTVGYTTPTPIQAQAIPYVLEGRDLLGIAQTGTGKTAAFSLPIIDRLTREPRRSRPGHPRALILTPTRELAAQILENLEEYGCNTELRYAVIFGGVSERPQIAKMQAGVDILVATPGRLMDLMGQRHIKLDRLEVFVLDEADRMLDMGFIHDMRKVIAVLPKERQTLFFSATMPQAISQLASSLLMDPARVEITPPATTVERIDQSLMYVEKTAKNDLLVHLLETSASGKTHVFGRTKHGCDKIVRALSRAGIKSAAIHGNKSQNARVRALRDFRDDSLMVLVATDIAARGIDVDGIQTVINYDLPNEPESYVHRIGRTARAGRDGQAIALCDASEQKFLRDIQRVIGMKIRCNRDHEWDVDHDPNAPQHKQGGGGGGRGRGRPHPSTHNRNRPSRHRR